MSPARNGCIRLFRVMGIDVFVHWSWLVVAIYQINEREAAYSSLAWNTAEYLALFFIVLLHEFGHALACRQVGGKAEQIMLWPLGGVAYITAPQRPGAVLWSIAAGPLVNLVLAAVLLVLSIFAKMLGWWETMPDVAGFTNALLFINVVLLIFNLLPIYPLDGGQILRALLWFVTDRARSLLIASFIGFGGVALLVGVAIWMESIWMGILAFFVFTQCRQGWTQARALTAMANAPRHAGYSCPSCHVAPPILPLWLCPKCRTAFDTFETGAECPKCRTQFSGTQCLDCGVSSPLSAWETAADAGTVAVTPHEG